MTNAQLLMLYAIVLAAPHLPRQIALIVFAPALVGSALVAYFSEVL
jgi:hypothetical protein